MPSGAGTALGWGNRGAFDIINLVLIVCINGSMITHIMYKCNLNSKQTQLYVSFLLRCGLLKKEVAGGSNKVVYHATDRARKYLELFSELSKIFDLTREPEIPA